jgi:hypothetical protein
MVHEANAVGVSKPNVYDRLYLDYQRKSAYDFWVLEIGAAAGLIAMGVTGGLEILMISSLLVVLVRWLGYSPLGLPTVEVAGVFSYLWLGALGLLWTAGWVVLIAIMAEVIGMGLFAVADPIVDLMRGEVRLPQDGTFDRIFQGWIRDYRTLSVRTFTMRRLIPSLITQFVLITLLELVGGWGCNYTGRADLCDGWIRTGFNGLVLVMFGAAVGFWVYWILWFLGLLVLPLVLSPEAQ